MSPSGSKTFAPKETELDRILAREKFILEKYEQMFGEEYQMKFTTDLGNNFWEIMKVILG
jgi:hypothetical protein